MPSSAIPSSSCRDSRGISPNHLYARYILHLSGGRPHPLPTRVPFCSKIQATTAFIHLTLHEQATTRHIYHIRPLSFWPGWDGLAIAFSVSQYHYLAVKRYSDISLLCIVRHWGFDSLGGQHSLQYLYFAPLFFSVYRDKKYSISLD